MYHYCIDLENILQYQIFIMIVFVYIEQYIFYIKKNMNYQNYNRPKYIIELNIYIKITRYKLNYLRDFKSLHYKMD